MNDKATTTTHQNVSLLWLHDLGVTGTVNPNGDVTYKGKTLTREQMIAGEFGTAKQVLANFIKERQQ